MPHSTAPSGAANESNGNLDAPILRIISFPPFPREQQNLHASPAPPLSRAPFLTVNTMDGNATLPCSDRTTPPNSPIKELGSPTDDVKPATLDTNKPLKDGLSSSEQVAALLKISGELATAVERLTTASKTASWGKKPEPEEDGPEIEPGSTLAYKRVDEMYVSRS